jgi:hypothetical protein
VVAIIIAVFMSVAGAVMSATIAGVVVGARRIATVSVAVTGNVGYTILWNDVVFVRMVTVAMASTTRTVILVMSVVGGVGRKDPAKNTHSLLQTGE